MNGSTSRSHGRRRLHPQALAAAVVDAQGRRHHHLFDGVMKAVAIGGSVIEAQHLLPAISPVVGLAGIVGDLEAHGQQLLPQFIDGVPVGKLALGSRSARLSRARAGPGPGKIGLKLRRGQLLAFPLDGLRPDDLVVLCGELDLFGEQRQVLAAEQVGFGVHVAQGDFKTGRLQSAGKQLLLERLRSWLQPEDKLVDESHKALLGGCIGCVYGGSHLKTRVLFAQAVIHVGPVRHPAVRRWRLKGCEQPGRSK